MGKLLKVLLVSILCAILFGGLLLGSEINPKEIGASKYYVQINKDGNKEYDGKYNGEDVYTYRYNNIKAYNSKGEKIEVKFFADKNLRKEAFLLVKVKDIKDNKENDILSYEEVKQSELPKKVKESFNVK